MYTKFWIIIIGLNETLLTSMRATIVINSRNSFNFFVRELVYKKFWAIIKSVFNET